MYHRFKWTRASRRRNSITIEYEPLQPYFLLTAINAAKCRTFADIGSNIGAYSVLMSQAPSVEKIFAFDANHSAAREMQANFLLNELDVEIRTVAVSEKNGVLTFGTVSRLAGNNAVVDTSETRAFHKIEQIECVRLDDTLEGCAEPLALKIDVEGHEEKVLKGAERLLERPCLIQVENFENRLNFPEGYSRIAQIGPDSYYSNMPGLQAGELFEQASTMMIESNHERKSASMHAGDFSVSVSGRSYEIVKHIILKFFKSRL